MYVFHTLSETAPSNKSFSKLFKKSARVNSLESHYPSVNFQHQSHISPMHVSLFQPSSNPSHYYPTYSTQKRPYLLS
jgi:hypothetical protein